MSSSTLSSKQKSVLLQNQPFQQSSKQIRQQPSLINDSDSQQQLQRVKQEIQLSKQELISIVNKNHFGQKVYCFNNQAKKLIQLNKIEEALLYLNQCQKILEYAASCGKNIQRKTIVQILHNLACCYQILWDLENCSNYIEALIFNLNSELKFGDFQSNTPSQIQMSASKKSFSTSKLETYKLQKKLQLSKYYLLYCAMNSQLKNNEGALVAAKKASQITKSIFTQTLSLFESQKQSSLFVKSFPLFVTPMLQQLIRTSSSISIHQIDNLHSLTQHYIKIYNSKCLFNNLSSVKQSKSNLHEICQSKQVCSKFKSFSIGNIMQLNPMGDSSDKQIVIIDDNMDIIKYENILQYLIVFSICHFTMATQLRYIALTKAGNNKQHAKSIIEYKESETYHLLSILIAAMYIPFDVLYMQHIISSYHSHYEKPLVGSGFDGTPQLGEEEIQKLKQKFVFPKSEKILSLSTNSKREDELKKCSTTNQSNDHSLIVSFQDQSAQEMSKDKNSSLKKSFLKKVTQKSIISDDQADANSDQMHLFDEYYYVKKNTEPNQETLRYEQPQKVKRRPNMKKGSTKSKSKSKSKQSLKKITNFGQSKLKLATQISTMTHCNKSNLKTSRKSGSRSKIDSFIADSQPSTIIVHNEKSSTENRVNSQFIPHTANSPKQIPQIYSKISKKSQIKSQLSKQHKFAKVSIHNFDSMKHQSEYFNKQDTRKCEKKIKREDKENKPQKRKSQSKQILHRKKINIEQQDQIKRQYFHVQNPNLIKEKKSPFNKLNGKATKNSSSKTKKQRPSSKSIRKSTSPMLFPQKESQNYGVNQNNSKQKQKKLRMTAAESRGIGALNKASQNRRSISGRKVQRNSFKKTSENVNLKHELSTKTMKASHFDKYYL